MKAKQQSGLTENFSRLFRRMIINGLQKLTLIDYPDELACTIFIYGCNFRCGFCHNPELVIGMAGNKISEEEFLIFLEKRKKYLGGVCITGGEPLMSLEINFLKKIKEIGYKIKIDTNGSFPDKLKEIIKESLVDYIAMDIKSSKEKYPEVAKANVDINKIEQSIKIISEFPDYEFRTTVLESIHTKKEIEKIMEWLEGISGKKLKRFCFQGFKNNGKFVDEEFSKVKDTRAESLNELKEIAAPYFGGVIVRV